MRNFWIACFFISLLLLIQNCQPGGTSLVNVNLEIPHKKLSQYNFFTGNMADLIPNLRIMPYDLNTPLFSDYAYKQRFIYIPEGKQASYVSEHKPLNFPMGTVLIKNFYYPEDFRNEKGGRRIMETRLLIHSEEGWEGWPYIWNEAQTEAVLEVAGGRKAVSWIHSDGEKKELEYVVPNKNQCAGCHEIGDEMQPIGPKIGQLNRPYEGKGDTNQLEAMIADGFLEAPEGSIADHPKTPVWNDPETGSLDHRARAWLDINCAHCHRPDGPASTSALFLRQEDDDPSDYGVCKTPVAAGQGSGGFLLDIVPGKPEESILIFRMESVDPGIMMPELGRKLIHEEGLALIREWIAAMETWMSLTYLV